MLPPPLPPKPSQEPPPLPPKPVKARSFAASSIAWFQSSLKRPRKINRSTRIQYSRPTMLVIGAASFAVTYAVISLSNREGGSKHESRSKSNGEYQKMPVDALVGTLSPRTNMDPIVSKPVDGLRSAGSASTKQSTIYAPPPEITSQQQWPTFALQKAASELASISIKSDKSLYPFFSPNGTYLIVLYGRRFEDVRIWNVRTGSEVKSEHATGDGFTTPAAFSPDESKLACLDGEFLRLWNLSDSQASAVQVQKLTHAKNLDGQEHLWNSVAWSAPNAIILRSHFNGDWLGNTQYQVSSLDFKSAQFTLSRQIAIPSLNGKRKPKDVALSPDGQYVAILADDELVVCDSSHGKPVKRLTVGNIEPAQFPFPSRSLHSRIVMNHWYFEDRHAGLNFTPDGSYLIVATQVDRVATVRVVDSRKWREVLELDFARYTGTKEYSYSDRFQPYCISPDGTMMAGIFYTFTITSRKTRTERRLVVFSLATGRSQEIDIGRDFDSDSSRNYFSNREDCESVVFSRDGQSLVVAVINERRWSDKERRSEATWRIGSWRLKDASKLFELSGLLDESGTSSAIRLSPDGQIAITKSRSVQMWDIPHLVKLRSDFDQGELSWSKSNYPQAFSRYCAIISDELSPFFGDELPRAYSRCIDVFAKRGETAKGRSIVVLAQQRKIAISPETDEGKSLIHDFASELKANRDEKERLASIAETKRSVEVRAQNKARRVSPRSITKRQFIEKLKETMAGGRIDRLMVDAIFSDDSFLDVFGEPDSNVEWVDSQRLVQYRCSDGAIQLTVRFVGSMTFLHGINTF